MEQTMNTTGGVGQKIIIGIIIIVALVGVILALRQKAEAPQNQQSGASMTNDQIQAELNAATTVDSESSLKAIDAEFK